MAVVHQELLRESLAATGHVETACPYQSKKRSSEGCITRI